MSTSGPDKPELNRVFNTSGLLFAAEADETHTVVDALSAVSVADVQGHRVPFHVKKQPIQTAVSHLVPEAKKPTACVPSGDMSYELFCTAHPPEPGGSIYFGDTGDVVGRSCDRADGRELAVYVINPYLGVFDQLLRLNLSLIQGHGKVDLRLAVECQDRFLSLQGRAGEREETHRVVAEFLTKLSD